MKARLVLLVLMGLGELLCNVALAAEYDPLAVDAKIKPATVDLTVSDKARQRELPIRVFLPVEKKAAPVVFFSHGLGGNRNGCAYLGRHWSARGYVAVFTQHPGSDDSVWKGQAMGQRMTAMRSAASGENLVLRAQDIHAVLDQLALWSKQSDHALAERLDLEHVGMSGHSFGAQTTQAVSGQTFPLVGQRYTDKRIDAAIAFSPGAPLRGDAAKAFADVKIPWLLMTGTNDVSPIGGQDVASRLAVFKNLPQEDKYELVLDKAEHSAFTEGRLAGDKRRPNPNHHRAILAISTAFWDAYLRNDAEAKAWLIGAGPRSILETDDRWQQK